MFKLPDALRAELARPMGKVLTTSEALDVARGRLLIAVGDVCSERFLEAGRAPDVIVADWRTQRTADLHRFRERATREPDVLRVRVKNPPGVITEPLWDAIVTAVGAATAPVRRRTLVEVDGEEDLAALPALLLAPEGAVVAYGQPPVHGYAEGVVTVIVAPDVRRHVRSILERFEVA